MRAHCCFFCKLWKTEIESMGTTEIFFFLLNLHGNFLPPRIKTVAQFAHCCGKFLYVFFDNMLISL